MHPKPLGQWTLQTHQSNDNYSVQYRAAGRVFSLKIFDQEVTLAFNMNMRPATCTITGMHRMNFYAWAARSNARVKMGHSLFVDTSATTVFSAHVLPSPFYRAIWTDYHNYAIGEVAGNSAIYCVMPYHAWSSVVMHAWENTWNCMAG